MPAPKDDPRAAEQRAATGRAQTATEEPDALAKQDVVPATEDAAAASEAPTAPDEQPTDVAAAQEPAPEPPPEPDVLLVLPDGETLVTSDGTPYRPSHGDPVHVRPEHVAELLARGAHEPEVP